MTLVEIKRNKNSARTKKLVKKHNRLQAEFAWIFAHLDMLRSKYPNQYVAVRNKKVAYHSENVEDLLNQVKNTGEKLNNFAVEYVRKEPTCFLL